MNFTIGGTAVQDITIGGANVNRLEIGSVLVWARKYALTASVSSSYGTIGATLKTNQTLDAEGNTVTGSTYITTSGSTSAGDIYHGAALTASVTGTGTKATTTQESGIATSSLSVAVAFEANTPTDTAPSSAILVGSTPSVSNMPDDQTYTVTKSTPRMRNKTVVTTYNLDKIIPTSVTESLGYSVSGSLTLIISASSSTSSTSYSAWVNDEGAVTYTSVTLPDTVPTCSELSYVTKFKNTTTKFTQTYTFNGWSATKQSASTTAAGEYEAGGTYELTSDMTLYAVWKTALA